MKRLSISIVAISLALGLTWVWVNQASAYTAGPVIQDAGISSILTNNTFNDPYMNLSVTNDGSCAPVDILVYEFDLSSLVGDPRVGVTGVFTLPITEFGDGVSFSAELRSATDTSWNEATVTYASLMPSLEATQLAVAALPASPVSGVVNVIFSSTDLGSYLNTHRGQVTLVVQAICTPVPGGTSALRVVAEDSATLGLYTATSVNLVSVSANSPAPSYLLAGLALLLAATTVAFLLLRRRSLSR